MIKFRTLPDGAFVAGDTDTSRTAYAYPTSVYARAAQKRPELVAFDMVTHLTQFPASDPIAELDARNWERINGGARPLTNRPGEMAAAYAEETGCDYATALVHCNMD